MSKFQSQLKPFLILQSILLVALIISIFFEPSVVGFATRCLIFSVATKFGYLKWSIFNNFDLRDGSPVFFWLCLTAFLTLVFDLFRVIYTFYL